MTPETYSALTALRRFGARVQVFGREVYVCVPSDSDLIALAAFYHVEIEVVICTVGRATAADAITYEADGYVFRVQGPARVPSGTDYERAFGRAS